MHILNCYYWSWTQSHIILTMTVKSLVQSFLLLLSDYNGHKSCLQPQFSEHGLTPSINPTTQWKTQSLKNKIKLFELQFVHQIDNRTGWWSLFEVSDRLVHLSSANVTGGWTPPSITLCTSSTFIHDSWLPSSAAGWNGDAVHLQMVLETWLFFITSINSPSISVLCLPASNKEETV